MFLVVELIYTIHNHLFYPWFPEITIYIYTHISIPQDSPHWLNSDFGYIC